MAGVCVLGRPEGIFLEKRDQGIKYHLMLDSVKGFGFQLFYDLADALRVDNHRAQHARLGGKRFGHTATCQSRRPGRYRR
jgi:hypothetical protein